MTLSTAVRSSPGAGAVVFLISCLLVAQGLRDSSLYSDVHVYSIYGGKMADGQVPYRDFFNEYPPLAQPVFLLGRVAGATHYALAFKALMALFGLGALACSVVTLRRLRARPLRAAAAVAVISVSPLLVGPIFLNAYDLWPAFLLSLALMLLVLDRPLLAFGVLGAAVAAKLYPIAVLPLALLYVDRRLRRAALLSFAGVVVLAHLPFAAAGPRRAARELLAAGEARSRAEQPRQRIPAGLGSRAGTRRTATSTGLAERPRGSRGRNRGSELPARPRAIAAAMLSPYGGARARSWSGLPRPWRASSRSTRSSRPSTSTGSFPPPARPPRGITRDGRLLALTRLVFSHRAGIHPGPRRLASARPRPSVLVLTVSCGARPSTVARTVIP